jgi:lipopolysaccharide/colanic/teichoic acid biosynthesis glycosyltransferase
MDIDVATTSDTEGTRVRAYAYAHPAATPSRAPLEWTTVKRLVDVLLAVVLLLVLAPLLLVIAVAIGVDTRGPLLFRQERIGREGRRFTMLKFRTMHDGVSPEIHRHYISQLVVAESTGSRLQKLTGDARVTRVGALLRRTSLDELPQLVNVLRGEMAIVGPRPALLYELEHYEDEHYERFAVRPGMTGLWQVSGRSEIGFLGMLALDVEYTRTLSPRVDAMILLRTPLALISGNAA